MRRFLFDKQGDVCFYLTGAGVLYNTQNVAVGHVQQEEGLAQAMSPVVAAGGQIFAWFDDAFLWTLTGEVLAFIKGAKPEGDLDLPKTKRLEFTPEPKPAPFQPLLLRATPPEKSWQWASETLGSSLPQTYA